MNKYYEGPPKWRRNSLTPLRALKFRRLTIEPRPPSIGTLCEMMRGAPHALSVRRYSLAERNLVELTPAELACLEEAMSRYQQQAARAEQRIGQRVGALLVLLFIVAGSALSQTATPTRTPTKTATPQ